MVSTYLNEVETLSGLCRLSSFPVRTGAQKTMGFNSLDETGATTIRQTCRQRGLRGELLAASRSGKRTAGHNNIIPPRLERFQVLTSRWRPRCGLAYICPSYVTNPRD
ncbi:hypothetical protein BDR07DRAFT_1399776 [Suillus spraguei]|nr:hypothetical protein BDR07DRAFT_1399776 [Suillus spraguei]